MAAPYRKDKFRKVSPQIWGDEKFRALPLHSKLAFLFVLTHPNLTALGAMRHTAEGMAAEMGWEAGEFRQALGELTGRCMVQYDAKASFVWLPNFLRYNEPDNPNVVKGWRGALALLPECEGKRQLIRAAKAVVSLRGKAFEQALPEPFRKPFGEPLPEPFGEGMPNMEQEQEQEQHHQHPEPPYSVADGDDDAALRDFALRPLGDGGFGLNADVDAKLFTGFSLADLRFVQCQVAKEHLRNPQGRTVSILRDGPNSPLMRQLREQAAARKNFAQPHRPPPVAPDFEQFQREHIARLIKSSEPTNATATASGSSPTPNASPEANAGHAEPVETPA